MFCFLVTYDHVADDFDTSDAGYLEIAGPKLSATEVEHLHTQCLTQGTPFRLCGTSAEDVCYEGKLCNLTGPAHQERLLNWAKACSRAEHLLILNAQQEWVEARAA